MRRVVSEHIDTGQIQAVITTGGTGISRRDSTYEALTELFEKRLDGFGELFRTLSFEEIGAAAMLSRATAGVIRGCAVFMLPGSEAGGASGHDAADHSRTRPRGQGTTK